MIKLIIFDLDDTLYPETEYVQSGFKAVADFLAQRTGLKTAELMANLLGSLGAEGRGKNFDTLLRHFGLNDVSVADLVKVYREHRPEISLSKKTESALGVLKKKYHLALLTNGWAEVQQRKVAALGLERYFDAFFYAQENGLDFRKPHQKYFLKVLEHYDCAPEEALMVGDDPAADITGAKSAGLRTFLVTMPGDISGVVNNCL